MNNHQDDEFLKIGEIAEQLSVSAQTLRVWENNGLLSPVRSPGGHRLYSLEEAQRASQIALLRRRHGMRAIRIRDAQLSDTPEVGSRIRQLRSKAKLSQKTLADIVGVSRSHLGSIERGDLPASFDILSRIADELGIAARELGPDAADESLVLNDTTGRRTILDGVAWTELAGPGHAIEPALLEVPSGASSGHRHVSRPGETFFYILSGTLRMDVVGNGIIELLSGDAMLLPARTQWLWVNDGQDTVRALYIEQTLARAGKD